MHQAQESMALMSMSLTAVVWVILYMAPSAEVVVALRMSMASKMLMVTTVIALFAQPMRPVAIILFH